MLGFAPELPDRTPVAVCRDQDNLALRVVQDERRSLKVPKTAIGHRITGKVTPAKEDMQGAGTAEASSVLKDEPDVLVG